MCRFHPGRCRRFGERYNSRCRSNWFGVPRSSPNPNDESINIDTSYLEVKVSDLSSRNLTIGSFAHVKVRPKDVSDCANDVGSLEE